MHSTMERPVLAKFGGGTGGFKGGNFKFFVKTRGFLTRGFAISDGRVSAIVKKHELIFSDRDPRCKCRF